MELDLDPISRTEERHDFIESNFDFEFDESERDFLSELAQAIPSESRLDSSKAVGVRNI